jgi:hopanoid biosynthesis associated radical SAM protein HpnH
MGFRLGLYLAANWAGRRQRFPLVLMLEPTEQCNLRCAGCGRIREYRERLDERLTPAACFGALEETGAPVVAISGGEPLLHPEIDTIVKGIIARGRYVHLCSNGLLLRQSLEKFEPGPRMSFVLHVDSLRERQDAATGRPGGFDTAMEAIRAAKQRGFRVYTNTTIFKGVDFREIEALFTKLSELGVDALMISPAFGFEAVGNGAYFGSREEIIDTLRPLSALRRRFRFYNTAGYLRFLTGEVDVDCLPWSTPTLTPSGWRQPCYLIADTHCSSYRELLSNTAWERYGPQRDPRCAKCMVHCGFEAGVLDHIRRRPLDLRKMVGR